jgi:hypothetical protein
MVHSKMTAELHRRRLLQLGCCGAAGLSVGFPAALPAAVSESASSEVPRAKSVIYVYLPGGLSQLESFDMKPLAPSEIRGDFSAISTQTPGLQICEHLPQLALRSRKWALVRTISHGHNDHAEGHMIMHSGRSELPPNYNPENPQPTDWPSIASIVGATMPGREALPSTTILPERLIHLSGYTVPGQFGGMMGRAGDPWFIDAASFSSDSYGAFPEYTFHFNPDRTYKNDRTFEVPNLTLGKDLAGARFEDRLALLDGIEGQSAHLAAAPATQSFERDRRNAESILSDERSEWIFGVTDAEPGLQERYGRNSFGWSLLMAYRLVASGVRFVHVHLGNNGSWDAHWSIFPVLKDKLFPPTDRALCALLDDLDESGLLSQTLVVVAGEFGRTPKISLIPGAKYVGRDHWGPVQSALFAGAGVRGGHVIGATDSQAAYPVTQSYSPERFAATLYDALGVPRTAMWHDQLQRPHHVYHDEPIAELW